MHHFGYWNKVVGLDSTQYRCFNCGNLVASDRGFATTDSKRRAHICPHCAWLTSFWGERQVPAPRFGNSVSHIPQEVSSLYDEIRDAFAAGAYRCCVAGCRVMLMHIATERGAKKKETFAFYVDHLVNEKLVPMNSEQWIDAIRQIGNEVNHLTAAISADQARTCVMFIEALLRLIYEFPQIGQGLTAKVS